MIWMLIGCIWLFLHRPYEVWTWLAVYHIERAYVIAMVVLWLVRGPSLPRGNRLHACFAAFVLALLASWLTSPCESIGTTSVENYLKCTVFYVVLVTSVRSEDDLRRILAGYLASMAIWMAHCLREYINGSRLWAQGIERLVPVGHSYDFNDFAGLIVCSLPFAWVLWQQWPDTRKRLLLLGYFCLAGYSIMLSGSRMGFVGALVTVLIACLTSRRRWRLVAILPVILFAVWTILPPDRQARYFTLYDPDSGAVNGAERSAGNYRLAGFEAAWPMFCERPLLGYGPMGFLARKGWMPHNLYGQLLAELGLAGAIAFASLFWGVGCNIVAARRIRIQMSEIGDQGSEFPPLTSDLRRPTSDLAWHTVAAVGAAYFVLAIMAWGFNFLYWQVWLWFGGFQVVALQCLYDRAESAGDLPAWPADDEFVASSDSASEALASGSGSQGASSEG